MMSGPALGTEANTDGVRLEVRSRRSGECAEHWITATPESAEDSAEVVFGAVARTLEETGAAIFAERIFARAGACEAVDAARRSAYGDHDDGVPPTRLLAPDTGVGALAGVQVHALETGQPLEPLELDGALRGRRARAGDLAWISLGDLIGGSEGSPAQRATRMLDASQRALAAAGCTFKDVVRTWLWLGDILPWYDDLNAARNEFFTGCGLVGPGAAGSRLPASTGIGIHPAQDGGFCTMDLIAAQGAAGISHHEVAGEQHSAFDYGSAFSRATTVCTPAGETLFVSGTAAIDDSGASEHLGQAGLQIEATLAHVRALLLERGSSTDQVLSAIAYCKDHEVYRTYTRDHAPGNWPCVTLVADVCRPELLFEIEVTAAVGDSATGV